MEKDEKILKKIGKLLTIYGVNDEEKQKFLADVQDTKYDDQEELESGEEKPVEESPTEESLGEEKPVEEQSMEEKPAEEQPQEEVASEEKVEENSAEETVEEQPQEEVANESEKPVEEQPTEELAEEETVFDPQAKIEEQQKTIDGLVARISSLEDIVSKLSVSAEEDKTIGASSSGNPVEEGSNDAFDEINRKRVG